MPYQRSLFFAQMSGENPSLRLDNHITFPVPVPGTEHGPVPNFELNGIFSENLNFKL